MKLKCLTQPVGGDITNINIELKHEENVIVILPKQLFFSFFSFLIVILFSTKLKFNELKKK